MGSATATGSATGAFNATLKLDEDENQMVVSTTMSYRVQWSDERLISAPCRLALPAMLGIDESTADAENEGQRRGDPELIERPDQRDIPERGTAEGVLWLAAAGVAVGDEIFEVGVVRPGIPGAVI